MKYYKKIQSIILHNITPTLNKKYFVLCEYLKDYQGVIFGRKPVNNFGDVALIYAVGDNTVEASASFKEAVKHYSKNGYKVYHLKKGLKVMFSKKLMPGTTQTNCPELGQLIDDWWFEWCNYANQSVDRQSLNENLGETGYILEDAVKKVFRNK